MGIFSKIRQTVKFLRLKPFDTSNAEGREHERHRRIAISSASAFIGQGVNYVVMIAMVPLLIKHLGQEQYGLWLAVSSMASFTVFADFGLGNGLINVLGKAHGLDDRKVAREYVSSGFFMLMGISLMLALIGLVLLPQMDWNNFFHLETLEAKGSSHKVVWVFFLIFLINLPFSIVQKVQMAYQENYINSLWLAVGKVGMLIGAVVGVMTQQTLLYFVIVLAGVPVIMMILNSGLLYGRRRPWLRPGWSYISLKSTKELCRTGLLFFAFGISGVLSVQIDTLVIGKFLGATEVPTYAIPLRLFMVMTTLLGFIMVPLWPAYREAIVRDDVNWVRKTFWRTMKLSGIISVPFALLLVAFAPFIIRLWIGGSISIPASLLIALGVQAVVTALTAPMSMLLNGSNIIGVRAIFSILSGLFNLVVSIFLVHRIGVAGPIIGTIFAQILFGWSISIFYLRRVLVNREEVVFT